MAKRRASYWNGFTKRRFKNTDENNGTFSDIGDIGNYYGNLVAFEKEGKFFWQIEGQDEAEPEEISKELYDQLVDHEERIIKRKVKK